MKIAERMNRLIKSLLAIGCALFMSIAAVDNIWIYEVNFEYVQHIMLMDTTFQNPQHMQRAIQNPQLHHLAYITMITCEGLAALMLWVGAWQMFRNLKADTHLFNQAKLWAVNGLSFAVFIYVFFFYAIGNEWFASWQSKVWNAKKAALPVITMLGCCLIYLNQTQANTRVSN